MPTHFLLNAIDDEALRSLMGFLEQVEGPKVILIDSPGGLSDTKEAMLYLLNQDPSNIKMVVFGQLNLAAFDLFARFKGDKEILDTATSCIHVNTLKLHSFDLKEENSVAFLFEQVIPEGREKQLQLYKRIGLNEESLSSLSQGKDVFLTCDQLRVILL